MSQGDNVVINPLERALSEDINNLQSVERSRRLGEIQGFNRGCPRIDSLAGKAVTGGLIDQPGTSVAGVRSGVLGGLDISFPANFPTVITIQPGALMYFDLAAAPDANYDPNAYKVGRLAQPLTGVTPGATYGGTPIPPAAAFAWLLVARAVDTTTVTTPREVYDPGTGAFVTQNVPKLQEGQIEFMFLDADGATVAYPGDEWQMIGLITALGGVLVSPVLDWRQLLSADGNPGVSQVDQNSISYVLGAQQIHDLEYTYKGQRHYFAQGNIAASTYLDPADGPIGAGERYSMWTFDCRRPDGSYFRPPAPGLGAYGPANILLSDETTNLLYNGSAMGLPSVYGFWSNWILGYGGGSEIQPGDAVLLGAFATQASQAQGQRLARNGRSLVNMENTRYSSLAGVGGWTTENRFGFIQASVVNGSQYVGNVTVTMQDFAEMTAGAGAKAIKYRLTTQNFGSLVLFDGATAAQNAVLFIKTSSGAPTEANTLLAVPLTVPTLAANEPMSQQVVEFWWPVGELGTAYIDIREGDAAITLFTAGSIGAAVNFAFDVMEWRF